MRTDLFNDIQGRVLTAGLRTSAAAVVGPWYRGDTVTLSIHPLQRTGNQWAPFVTFVGLTYSVAVRLSTKEGVALATSAAWTWGHDDDDGTYPVESYNRWLGSLLLTGQAVDAAVAATGSAECILEIELTKAGEHFTTAQHAVTLKKDYIT